MSVQISLSFSFQVFREFCRFWTTQLSDIDFTSFGQTHTGLPFVRGILTGNEGQNLLGEGDDDAAGQSQEAVGTLAGIVGLEGKTHLNNAPAQ